MSVKAYLREALNAHSVCDGISFEDAVAYGSVTSGTASATGWLCVNMTSTASNDSWGGVLIDGWCVANWNGSWYNGGGSTAIVPIKKGQGFSITSSNVKINNVWVFRKQGT